MRHKIFRLLTLLALGWMGAACSSEKLQEPPAPWSPTDGVPTLTVSLGVEGATRSSEDDKDFEPGEGFENYLDIAGNDYRIYFFDAKDDTYLATFEPYLKPSANVPIEDGISYYNFMGKVPSNVGTKFKLVVLANWGTYPVEVAEEEVDETGNAFQLIKGVTTIENLTIHSEAQFEALTSPGENEDWLGPGRLIPFYGVRGYDLTDDNDRYGVNKYIGADGKLKGDIYVDLTDDPLPMLRAMAKVEVILDNAFASFSSVKMTRYNSKGFCAPYKEGAAFDYTDYFPEDKYDWDKDFFKGVHLVGGDNDNDKKELEFKKESSRTEGEGNKYTPEKWVAYVPEYKNIGVGDFTTIEVTLANPNPDSESDWGNPTKIIYFATDGTAANNEKSDVQATKTVPGRYDIERNNIYRFTISGMTTTLECQVDIQPFAEQKLVVDLGLMRDESGDLMVVPDEKGNLPDFFVEYMKSKSHPKDKYTGKDLDPYTGDYYAIRLGSDGDIKNAEVLLKDSDGCHVLTNFGEVDGTANCNTREVYDYTTGENYHKDKDGDQRLQHNEDHSSIVLDHDKTMYYKTNPSAPPVLRYRVESWDPSDTNTSGIFYYWKEISQPYTATEDNIKAQLGGVDKIPDYYKYLLEVDKDGNKKEAVTITIYEGDKTAAEHKDVGKVLEEYTDELKDMLSTKPAYIIID